MIPAQCRMARAGIRWTMRELAAAASVSRVTVVLFETGRRIPLPRTLAAIRAALEAAGVEFTDGDKPGVRLARKGGAE